VDRKDLDRQTREEFNRFQEGCVEENTNTAALVRRLLSDDYADKVIVTTIQKLGLALDENSKRNKQRKERPGHLQGALEPLRDKRIVFIFDECHRSQFGENHKAIKEFFPKAQLFGFTGTPIFEENASLQKIEDDAGLHAHHEDLFQKQLHAYTITHAIEDRNVLRFHVDYFKPEGKNPPSPARRSPRKPSSRPSSPSTMPPPADAASTPSSPPPPSTTPSSTRAVQDRCRPRAQAADPDFKPLNIACVFSPPAEGNKDVKQIQEDLPQEQADNKQDPGQEESRAQGHHRRLQRPLRHQPPHRASSTSTTRTCRSASRTSSSPMPTTPGRRRSTSPSSWTCCSPASIPST
jgi:type I restriction enzyme, R subunit